jgi:hypothetical protein
MTYTIIGEENKDVVLSRIHSLFLDFLNKDYSIPGAGLDRTIKGNRYTSKDVK